MFELYSLGIWALNEDLFIKDSLKYEYKDVYNKYMYKIR